MDYVLYRSKHNIFQKAACMCHKIIIQIKIELSIQPILYCHICGQPILEKHKMSLDHYIPKCHGGTDDVENLLPAHAICNSIKNDLMPDDFERQKLDLYKMALNKWHLKHKDKQIVETALKYMR